MRRGRFNRAMIKVKKKIHLGNPSPKRGVDWTETRRQLSTFKAHWQPGRQFNGTTYINYGPSAKIRRRLQGSRAMIRTRP